MPEPDDVVIGLDAGTTSAKLVAVDRSGTVAATASSDPIRTRASRAGASTQSAGEIWEALGAACRRGAHQLDRSTTHISAISVAAQSGSVIPIGLHGAAVTDRSPEVITWMDTRSLPVVESWDRATVATIRSRSGWLPSPGLGLSTISWLRSHADVEAERWASVDDYLVSRLVGAWITNPSNAAGMQLMDVAALDWSPELCRIAGIAPAALATIESSGEPAGELAPEAALSIGLPAGTPVVIGGHDQACAALALDVLDPGSALLSMGTAWVLTMVTDRADMAGMPDGFNLSPHVVPARWSVSQNLGGLGAALASALDEAGPSLEAEMEACAFEARRAVETAASTVEITDLTVAGGGTRSSQLVQLIADTVGVPLTVRADASWPALGAARLAAAACGWPSGSDPTLPTTTIRPRRDRDLELRYRDYCRRVGDRPLS